MGADVLYQNDGCCSPCLASNHRLVFKMVREGSLGRCSRDSQSRGVRAALFRPQACTIGLASNAYCLTDTPGDHFIGQLPSDIRVLGAVVARDLAAIRRRRRHLAPDRVPALFAVGDVFYTHTNRCDTRRCFGDLDRAGTATNATSTSKQRRAGK